MRGSKQFGRGVARLCVALAITGFLALAPSTAGAAVGAGMSITFPSLVTVGQTGVPAAVILRNQSTGADAGATTTVCNAGDPTPPCTSSEAGIVLVPSCGQLAGLTCLVGDPGVFALPATGTGRGGTSCAGTVFDITMIDASFGTVRFAPRPAGARVTLPGAGSTCAIDFSLAVQRSPNSDANPAAAGLQTVQAGTHTQFSGPLAADSPSAVGPDTSAGTTVRVPEAPQAVLIPSPVAPAVSLAPGPLVKDTDGDGDGDGVLDSVDRCRTYYGDRDNGCPSRLNADVRGKWRVNSLYSRLISLTVRARTGSRIELRCTGREGACPFTKRTIRETTRFLTGLTLNFKGDRVFPAKTRIMVKVTQRGTRGSYERLLTRTRRRLPSVVNRCLGSRAQIQRCP